MARPAEFDYNGEFLFKPPTETREALGAQQEQLYKSLGESERRIAESESFTPESAIELASTHIILDRQSSETAVKIAVLQGDLDGAVEPLKHVMLMDLDLRFASIGAYMPMKIYFEHMAQLQSVLAQQIDHVQGSVILVGLGKKYREMAQAIPERGEPLDVESLIHRVLN